MVEEAPRLVQGTQLSDVYVDIDPVRMRQERAEKMRRVLRKHSVPAILVQGAHNVRYLTGHWSWDFQPMTTYVLFFADHDPVVFAHAGSYHQLPDLQPWIKHWRIARSWFLGVAGVEASKMEASKFAAEVKEELTARGLDQEPLGLVAFDPLATESLRSAGLAVQDGTPLLLEASQTKTPDEVKCLQMAASLSTTAFQAGFESIKPGATHTGVSGEMVRALGLAGAENPRAKVAAGPLAFERGLFDVPRRIEYGDIGYMWTCGTAFMGYSACLYRTFVVGRDPSPREQDWYRELKDRIDRVIDAIKPGALTADAAKHFPPASKWGYKDEAEVLTVEYGHGLGMVNLASRHVNYNWPVINRQWSFDYPQAFEPGMVIAVESLEGEHRVGGARLENMVVVTDSGAELLDLFPCDDILTIK